MKKDNQVTEQRSYKAIYNATNIIISYVLNDK